MEPKSHLGDHSFIEVVGMKSSLQGTDDPVGLEKKDSMDLDSSFQDVGSGERERERKVSPEEGVGSRGSFYM